MGAIERRAFARGVLLPVAMVEDDLRRALDEQDLAALRRVYASVAMNRCSDSNGMTSMRG